MTDGERPPQGGRYNTTFLVWNCLHVARMLKDAGGIPAHGNQPEVWDAGCKTDWHSPEHKR